jgi:hypothetical protein
VGADAIQKFSELNISDGKPINLECARRSGFDARLPEYIPPFGRRQLSPV